MIENSRQDSRRVHRRVLRRLPAYSKTTIAAVAASRKVAHLPPRLVYKALGERGIYSYLIDIYAYSSIVSAIFCNFVR